MLYTEYKDLFQFALQSKSPHAVAYLADVGGKIVDSRIRSYTHTHSSLTDSERKQLYKLNGLNSTDVLIGGEIHRVVGDIGLNSRNFKLKIK